MAQRGRKPKPTAIKELEGNPGGRPLNPNEPRPDKKAPRCPSWLEEEAKKAKEEKGPEKLLQEAKSRVAKRYKDTFRRLHQETRQDHYDRYFNAVARSFDPHTNYIPPAGKEQFDISMRGSLEGIGALLREDDGFIKVMRIIPGSAAARQLPTRFMRMKTGCRWALPMITT